MINRKYIFNYTKYLKLKMFPNTSIILMYLVLFSTISFNTKLYSTTYPTATVNISNNPSPGYMLLGSYNITAGFYDNYGMAPDSLIKKWTNLKTGADFKLHKNGLFTFYDHSKEKFMVLNSSLNIVDSVKCVGNYVTDFHDIQYNNNGNILIIGIDERIVDLSQIVINGKTNAKVKGFVLQELNPQKQLVWQWSTFDYFSVLDAVSSIDLTQNSVSFCHINAAIYDSDGNIIISSRFMDELTKINRQTSQIMWRLGGQSCENNQFSFINDTDENGYVGFSHQHTPFKMKNGNLLLFDNGNIKSNNQYTRVVEYELNEVAKTAKKVWEFRLTPDYYTAQMGSVQELENGNIFISWGKRQTEVTKTKTVVFDMEFQSDLSYRGYKFIHDMDALGLLVNSKKNYDFNSVAQKTNVELNVDTLNGAGLITIQRHKYTAPFASFNTLTPTLLPIRYVIHKSDSISSFKANFKIDTRTLPNYNVSDSVKVYFRSKENGGIFNQLNTIYGNNTIEFRLPSEGEIVFGFRLPLIAPNVSYPSNNSIGHNYKNASINWNKVANATSYKIQISKDLNFSTLVLDTIVGNVDKLIYNFSSYTKYYFRIKSRNSDEESNWSNVTNFETLISNPKLSSPTNNTYYINTKDTLKWETVLGANNYQLQLSSDINFNTNDLILNEIINFNTKIVNNLDYNFKYFWRVKALKDTTSSEFSQVYEFTTKLPTISLVSPQNNEKFVPLNVLLKWNKSIKDIFYQLDIAEDNKFTKIIYTDNKLIDSFTISKNLQNYKTYYWRLKSFDTNNKSDWSEIFEFTTIIITPKLLKPNNNQFNIDLNAKLTWEDVRGASKYKLQLSKNNEFNNIILDTLINDVNSAEIDFDITNLEIFTNYYWRVSAVNDIGVTDFSSIFSFTTRNKNFTPQPSLIIPINNANLISDSIKFEWTKVTSVKKYIIQVSETNTFNTLIKNDTLNLNTITIGDFIKNVKYFWRIMAIGEESNSNWSNFRNFTIKEENTILPNPLLNFPLNNAMNVPVKPILKWEDNIIYTKFYILISKDTLFDNSFEINDLTSNELDFSKSKLSQLDYETQYFWKVQGINTESSSNWSEVWNFITEKDTLNSSVDNNQIYESVEIYPTPFEDYVNIKFSSDSNRNHTFELNLKDLNNKIEIFNTIGQKFDVDFTFNKNIMTLNTSNLKSGVYLINFNNTNSIKTINYFIKILKLDK